MYAIQETACTCMYVANFVIYSINNKMDLVEPKRYQSIVSNASRQDNALRVVITDGSTDIALALIYRIFVDDVFGKDQPVFISLFEFESKAVFLDSVIIELTSCSPNLLHGKHPLPLGFICFQLSLAITHYHLLSLSITHYHSLLLTITRFNITDNMKKIHE